MIGKNTTSRVMHYYFINPTTTIHLRKLSRQLDISMPSIIAATERLSKAGLLTKIKEPHITLVQANRDSRSFTLQKRVHNLDKLITSGLIEELIQAYDQPKSIILFGSYARGEDHENSDVDIAICTHKKLSIDLSKYEKILDRTISIHEFDMTKISKEFKQSLINGIVLEGYL